MKNNLCFIMIFVFALGVIAPACGFAWNKEGKSFIEICTAKGIEKIAVNDSDAPTDPTQAPQPHDQCQFCFAQAHLAKDIAVADIADINFTFSSHQYFKRYQTTIKSASQRAYQSRAPPVLI